MRIRKRLSDLQLRRSEAAAAPSDQASDQSMAIASSSNRWIFPKNDETGEKMKQKEYGHDERWRMDAKKITNNDILKMINFCDGDDNILQPCSSSAQGDYEVVPLKKRKGSFDKNTPNEEIMSTKMKSKTNKKCGDHDHMVKVDEKQLMEKIGIMNSLNGGEKKSRRGNVIMEGSRCSRVNGRGWRCCQPTLVGYSLCEHHLGKGRLRSSTVASARRGSMVARGGDGGNGGCEVPPQTEEEEEAAMVRKKRTKVGVVKARSMSSLLSQI